MITINLLNFYDFSYEGVSIEESKFSFDSKKGINFALLHEAIKWRLAKDRSGFHQTKNIALVSGTTAKPYRQKGTGRARQGSMRANHMRGGGVVFGPNVRNYSYKLNKKVRKIALLHSILFMINNDKLFVLKDFDFTEHKSSIFKNALNKFSNHFNININSSFIFFGDYNENFKLATNNLSNVNLISGKGLNVYDILKNDYVCIDWCYLKKIVGLI